MMYNTLLVNLFGGPGTGKSTAAAYLYSLSKFDGINAELVREEAKWDAWKGTTPNQVNLYKKQSGMENIVLGKCNLVITDSPLLIGWYYTKKYAPIYEQSVIKDSLQALQTKRKNNRLKTLNVFLNRSKPYNPAGRYEDEDTAKLIDLDQLTLLEATGDTYMTWEIDRDRLDVLYQDVIKPRVLEIIHESNKVK